MSKWPWFDSMLVHHYHLWDYSLTGKTFRLQRKVPISSIGLFHQRDCSFNDKILLCLRRDAGARLVDRSELYL